MDKTINLYLPKAENFKIGEDLKLRVPKNHEVYTYYGSKTLIPLDEEKDRIYTFWAFELEGKMGWKYVLEGESA
jgi:hypothetical protein